MNINKLSCANKYYSLPFLIFGGDFYFLSVLFSNYIPITMYEKMHVHFEDAHLRCIRPIVSDCK